MARRLLGSMLIVLLFACSFLFLTCENASSQNNSKIIFTIEKEKYLAYHNETISINFSAQSLITEPVSLTIELKKNNNTKNESYTKIDILYNSTQNYTLEPYTNLNGSFKLKPINSQIAKGYFLLSVIVDNSLFFEKEIVVSFAPQISAKLEYPITNEGLGYFELYSNSTIYANFTNHSPYEVNLLSFHEQKRFRGISISLLPYQTKLVNITIPPPKKNSKSAHVAQFETFYFRIHIGEKTMPYSTLFGFDIYNEEITNISSFTFYGVYFIGAVAHLEPQAKIEPGLGLRLDSKFKVIVHSISDYEDLSLHASLFESCNRHDFLDFDTKKSIEVANWTVLIGNIQAPFTKIFEFSLRFDTLSSPNYFLEFNLSMKGQSLIFFENIDVNIKAWSVFSYDKTIAVKYMGQRSEHFAFVASNEINSFEYDVLIYENEKGSLFPYSIKDKMKLLDSQKININESAFFRNEFWVSFANLSWNFHYSHPVYLYILIRYQNVTYWSDCIKFLGAYREIEISEKVIFYPIAFLIISFLIPTYWRMYKVKRA
ncbi:MAG: hypothetical protein QXT63_05410 [Thermoplasmata archaeon]